MIQVSTTIIMIIIIIITAMIAVAFGTVMLTHLAGGTPGVRRGTVGPAGAGAVSGAASLPGP